MGILGRLDGLYCRRGEAVDSRGGGVGCHTRGAERPRKVVCVNEA